MNPEERARLAAHDEAFRSAPVAGMKNDVPDGEYHAVIDRFDVKDTKNGLKLVTEMTVAAGPLQGAELDCWHDLEDPERFKYTKAHLAAIEVSSESLVDLEDNLRVALDAPVRVSVSTSNGYKNLYVKQRLGDPITREVRESLQQATPYVTPDDTIPFLWQPDEGNRQHGYNPFA